MLGLGEVRGELPINSMTEHFCKMTSQRALCVMSLSYISPVGVIGSVNMGIFVLNIFCI